MRLSSIDERAVYVFIGHQFVQLDARGMQQFLLFHILRTVGIEVYFGLLVVQAGEVTDVIPFFYDAQAFFGERYGVAEVFQADFVLNVVVVFGCDVGYQVFDGNTGIGFALSFQLFQLLVIGSDVEAVKDSPVQVEPALTVWSNTPFSLVVSPVARSLVSVLSKVPV